MSLLYIMCMICYVCLCVCPSLDPDDYIGGEFFLTFFPNQTYATFDILIVSDGIVEGSEKFDVWVVGGRFGSDGVIGIFVTGIVTVTITEVSVPSKCFLIKYPILVKKMVWF